MTRRITKLFNIDVKSVDEEKRQVTFCFSDDSEDRMGEIVDQASWDTKNYMNNPLILWGHNPSEPENVLGQGVALDLNKNGKSFITAQFDDAETNPKADLVFRQVVKRTLRCVSAGFINHTFEHENDTPVLKDNELLEVSIVPIPANPRAIALAIDEGSISEKDAKWLLKSMKTESEFIEKKLKQEQPPKEKSMTDEQAAALTEAVEKLTATVEATNERLEAQDAKIAELTEQLKEDEETEEEKTAREAKEAADKKAQEEADAEAKKAEEERLAKEEEDKKNAGPNDDDELTDEVKAEIDAALEAQIEADAAKV